MINSKKSKKLKLSFNDLKMKPIKAKFDITTLDMIILFLYKESVLRTRRTLTNIKKLFDYYIN